MNSIVLVTGGSRGIGAATSKYLAKQNYAVCVNYNSNAIEANKVVADIEATWTPRCQATAFSYN